MIKASSNTNSYDITDISYVERIVIGSTSPESIPTQEESEQKMQRLNQCLQSTPKGRIIGTERSFSLIRIGEHQVVLESVAYHVGFKRKPSWLSSKEATAICKPQVDLDAVERIIKDNQ